ncbi:MAG: response regulator [Sneathiella sp.]|nr:response regulator [Sneathiella sp.]
MTDMLRMLIEFGQNLTLLIALTFLYSYILRKITTISRLYASLLNGILFGGIAIIGIQIPMTVADGIIVDGRTVIVMLASPFAGNIAGLVAGSLVAAFRFYLGGVGTGAGIGAIVTAMLIGMLFVKKFPMIPGTIRTKHLLALSSVMTGISLLWVFALPASIDALAILQKLVLPVGIMYPLGALVLGLLLAHEYRFLDLASIVQKSEARFKGLFENAGVSIWNEDLSGVREALEKLREEGVTNLRYFLETNKNIAEEIASQVKIISVNKATLKLFGADTQKDILNRVSSTVGPDAMAVFIDELCAIWDKKMIFRAEASFRTLDGQDLSAIITFKIPTTSEGYKSVPVSLIDVTERRQLEMKIRSAQKMEAIGQLTGGVSHDFNNLLCIIQGNLELLSDMLVGNKEALKRVEIAQRGVTRGVEITRKLLNFSNRNTQKQQLTSMNSFIENLKELIVKSVMATIKVETRLAKDLWHITTDPGDLENAILNLALNARDAMQDGGSLIIETANKTLDKYYVQRNPEATAGNYVMISVSDTGSGMTEQVKEKILEPFFTTKDVGKGTGLGLSMVYGFIQRSDGYLKVFSEVGKGTTVRLYIPCSMEDTANQSNQQETATPLPRGRETILIVDDEGALLDITSNYLNELGYTTITAENGQQALKVLDQNEGVDLLFSDVIMSGGINGYQLAQEAYKQHPSLKVLLTSGLFQSDVKKSGPYEGALKQLDNRVLEKPYKMSELALALRHTLDRAN